MKLAPARKFRALTTTCLNNYQIFSLPQDQRTSTNSKDINLQSLEIEPDPSLTTLGSGAWEERMSLETKQRRTPMRTITTESGIRTQSLIAVSSTRSSAIVGPTGFELKQMLARWWISICSSEFVLRLLFHSAKEKKVDGHLCLSNRD